MSAYSITLVVLALALLLPVPAYLAYCHFNKKDVDPKIVQTISLSLVIPALTLLAWDEFISSDVTIAVFAAAGGFYFAKYVGNKG